MIEQNENTIEHCPMCKSLTPNVLFAKVHRQQRWSLCRCSKCGLHYTSPRPTAEFLNQCYSGDYHSKLRAENATERSFGGKYQRYMNWLTPHLPDGGRVLDIGCSTGLLVKMLCERGYRAEGIELNPFSAEWGRSHYNVTIHNIPIEDCSFLPGTLDAIILTDVLEHMLHPRDFLYSISRYLVPHGLVLITFPDIRSLESRYFYLMSRLARRPWIWKNCHIPLHIWEFTKDTAVACFEGAGFRVVDFRRSQNIEDEKTTGLISFLNLPSIVLNWPLLASYAGTQMEFIIRRENGQPA